MEFQPLIKLLKLILLHNFKIMIKKLMKIHYYKMINWKKNNNKKIAQQNQLPVKIVLVRDQRNIIILLYIVLFYMKFLVFCKLILNILKHIKFH